MNNTNYRLLCRAFGLGREQVFELLGGQFTKSRIDGWGRSPVSVRNGSGNRTGHQVSRYRPMCDESFHIFCLALAEKYGAIEPAVANE